MPVVMMATAMPPVWVSVLIMLAAGISLVLALVSEKQIARMASAVVTAAGAALALTVSAIFIGCGWCCDWYCYFF